MNHPNRMHSLKYVLSHDLELWSTLQKYYRVSLSRVHDKIYPKQTFVYHKSLSKTATHDQGVGQLNKILTTMSTSPDMRITWRCCCGGGIFLSSAIVCYCGTGDVDSRASTCALLTTVVKQSNICLYAYMDIKYIKIHLLLCYDI